MGTKFWLEDPCILFTDIVFFPTESMSKEQKLNALTRLAIIIAIIMFALDYENWLMFLLVAIMLIIVFQYLSKSKECDKSKTSSQDKDGYTAVENFTIVPTRIDDEWDSTVVAPSFAEEWRIPPPAYDQYTNVADSTSLFEEPIRPQSYPYGQYLTHTNMMPADEQFINVHGNGGARSARSYANSAIMKHEMAFRENMMRGYKKSMNRRFRHNTADTFSPYHSY